VWGVTSLLRQSTTIRVGLSAFGFPFPAPTGVVDYRIQRPSANDRGNLFSSINSYAGSSLEFRRTERNSDGDLAMGVGLALYDNEFANGTDSRQRIIGARVLWTPTESLEFLPYFARSDISDDEVGPIFVPAGDYLPPSVERRRFLGPEWATYGGTATNAGLLSTWQPISGWQFRAGLFRSVLDDDVSHSNLVVDVGRDGAGRQLISVDPPAKSASTSGEIRATRTLYGSGSLHRIHASVRARDRDRGFGGSALFDLGPVTPAQMQAAPRPIPAFAEQTREAVDQWFAGLAYEGRWRDRAEASVGVSYSDYRKSTLVPGESIARATDRPLLWNGSVALNFSPDLAIYAGVARGLEESGVAPASAVNRNAALPAIETAQADAGVRWRVTQEMRFVAGVFEVRKPYFNLDERSVWRELGDVRNRGIELSLSGELREGLSAVAGAILLDSEVTGDAVTIGRVGRRPVGSTPRVLLLNMNWSPGVLPDTSFDIGVLHSGPIVASRNNVVHLPAYTSLDLGVRREIRFGPHPARIRVQATNVTDRDRFELQGAGAYGVAPGRLVTLSLSVDL